MSTITKQQNVLEKMSSDLATLTLNHWRNFSKFMRCWRYS